MEITLVKMLSLYFTFLTVLHFADGQTNPIFTDTPSDRTLGIINQNLTITWKYDSQTRDVIFRKFSIVQEDNIGIFNILTKLGQGPANPKGDYVGRLIFTPDATIMMANLRISDESYIGFTVEFDGGLSLFHKTFLEIGIPASITDPPLALNVILEGDNTNLQCEATGKDAPTVSWQLNGVTISNSDSRVTITETNLGITSNATKIRSELELQNALPTDLGVISCVASNDAGTDVFNTTHDVYFSPRATSLVTDPPGNQGILAQPLTLTCSANGNPTVYYAIYKDNVLLRNTSSGVLNFPQVAITDEGIYKCNPVNYLGAAPEQQISLVVTVPPILESSSPNQVAANLADTVVLQCVFYGEPEPTVTWSRLGQALPATALPRSSVLSTNASFTKVEGKLTITNAAREDYGTYICKAVNNFGQGNKSIDVDIQYLPTIQQGSTTDTLTLAPFVSQNSHQLFCVVDANPRATVQWYRGSMLITNASNTLIAENVILDEDNHVTTNNTLTLTDWTMDDTGSYKCIANNTRGSVERSMPRIIQYAPLLRQFLPSVTTHLEGDQVLIVCRFHSLPEATISWMKDESVVTNSSIVIDNAISQVAVESSLVSAVDIVSTLTIPQSQTTDAGNYSCTAVNAFGNIKNETSLIINFKPIETTSSTSIISGTKDQANLEVFCRWVSQPKPSIRWTFNGVNVTAGVVTTVIALSLKSTELESKLTLQSLGPQHSGSYVCIADNDIGSNQLEKTVIIAYAPVFILPLLTNVTLTNGNPVTLTCVAEGFPSPSLVWLKDGVPVDLSATNIGYTISETMFAPSQFRVASNLSFSSTSRTDSALFSCQVNNSQNLVSQESAVVINHPPIIAPSFNAQQNFTETLTVFSLECIVEAHPSPTIVWEKNGSPVSQSLVNDTTIISNQFETKISSQLMFSPGIKRTDYGDYQCKATNAQGSADKSVKAYVVYKPESISQLTGSLDLLKGTSTAINCTVRANPHPIVTWSKDNSPISSGVSTTTVSTSPSAVIIESILTLTNVAQSDSASYVCNALNDVSALVQTIAVNVQFKPELTIASTNYTINETSSLVLTCPANANPSNDLQYEWRRNGVIISSALSDSLTLSNAHSNTNGVYECTPRNSIGVGQTVAFYVTVKASPTVITNAQCLQRVNNASTVYFNCTCAGTGTPKPRVYWTKFPDLTVLSNTSILIVNANNQEDDGTYQCHFENSEGRATTNTAIAFFGDKFGLWSTWSNCNNTCGSGVQIRQRTCNIPPCDPPEVKIEQNCVDESCPGKLTGVEDEESWLIALYVLIPLLLVICILLILWLSRLNRNKEEKPVTVPVNSNISKPPSVRSIPTRQEIYLPNNHYGVLNAGYRPDHEQAKESKADKEMESIEVEMNFDAEGPESETDNNMALPPPLRNGSVSGPKDENRFENFPPSDYDFNDLDSAFDLDHSSTGDQRQSSPSEDDEEESIYMTPRPLPPPSYHDTDSTIFTSL